MTDGNFLGFVTLGDNLVGTLLTTSTALAPTNASATPTYRIYGSSGTPVLTGTLNGFRDSGTLTNATNVSPIVVTQASHGYQTGMRVTISGVSGNTGANGTFTITRIDGNSYSLDGSTGTGTYGGGGSVNVSGLYYFSIACTSGNGFASGQNYSIVFSYTVSTGMGQRMTFGVT